MDRVSVTSSNLHAVGYDPARRALQLEFHGRAGNSVYEYEDVPPDVHERLMNADSKGQFIHREIKGRFDYRKVEG